ncbi:hypothetical protein ABPG77_008511 [Micractinium sp. CCAP 211/92]
MAENISAGANCSPGREVPGAANKAPVASNDAIKCANWMEARRGPPSRRTANRLPCCPAALDAPCSLLPLDRIREELTCCVCLELAIRPATLPCGHNACRRCLDALFASAPQNERCPNCRAPVPADMPALATNASLKNLAEMLWPGELLAGRVAQQCLHPPTGFLECSPALPPDPLPS